MAAKNKMSLHPIPLAAVIIDHEAVEFSNKYDIRETPEIRYFHKGKMSIFQGELSEDHLWNFMMLARWPGLQVITNPEKNVKSFRNQYVVSVILWKGGQGKSGKEAEKIMRHVRKHVPRVGVGMVEGYNDGLNWIKDVQESERISKGYMVREHANHQDEDYANKEAKRTLPCIEIWTKFNEGRKVWCGWANEDFEIDDIEMLIKDFDYVNYARFNSTHSFNIWHHNKPVFVLFQKGDGSEDEMHLEHSLIVASKDFSQIEVLVASMKDVDVI